MATTKGGRAAFWGALLLFAILSNGCGLVTRPIDGYYKAAWIIEHWDDPSQFPPGSNLCTEPFCTRTDTVEKYVGGNKGYTSETNYYYCPEHNPTFFALQSRPDDGLYAVYWGIIFFISYGVVGLPFLLVLIALSYFWEMLRRLFRRQKEGNFAFAPDYEQIGLISYGLAFFINTVVWLMFIWW